MTDLINRATTRTTTRAPRPAAPAEGPRPLGTAALIAGLTAGGIGLVVMMSLAVVGWFLADTGTHGDTTDALRVGADAWLVGHGSGLVLSGSPVGVVPLGITAILLLITFRAGRWAARNGAAPEGPRVLARAVTMFAASYTVLAVITCVLASDPGATPQLGRALVGSVVLSALGGGFGLASATGWLERGIGRVPDYVRGPTYGALVSVLGLVAAGSLALATSLVLHLSDAATVVSGLHLATGDALSYLTVIALVAPNCVLLAVAYLIGPGFAFGVGTTVSPTAVSLGAVPAFPVLAAIPGDGPMPRWMLVLMGAPVVIAAIGAAIAQRRSTRQAYDLAALSGAASGVGAGALITFLVALAGGPLGNDRLAEVGAPTLDVLVIAIGGMGAGGLIGGLAMAWWVRRRNRGD